MPYDCFDMIVLVCMSCSISRVHQTPWARPEDGRVGRAGGRVEWVSRASRAGWAGRASSISGFHLLVATTAISCKWPHVIEISGNSLKFAGVISLALPRCPVAGAFFLDT
jgi:hypothetical protein